MSLFSEKSVEVETLDNGWALTWEDKTRNKKRDYSSTLNSIELPERGREIYTSRTALHKRLKQLL